MFSQKEFFQLNYLRIGYDDSIKQHFPEQENLIYFNT